MKKKTIVKATAAMLTVGMILQPMSFNVYAQESENTDTAYEASREDVNSDTAEDDSNEKENTNEAENSQGDTSTSDENQKGQSTDSKDEEMASDTDVLANASDTEPLGSTVEKQKASPVSDEDSSHITILSAVSGENTTDPDTSETDTSGERSNNEKGDEANTDIVASSPESAEKTNDTAQTEPDKQNKIEETAVDPETTAPNNVNTIVPSDDKQGSDISYKANLHILGTEIPIANSTATIEAGDANSDKTLGDVSQDFKGTDLGDVQAGDLVIKGDMSIEGDTTKDAVHDMDKDTKHDVKADLDVSAIHTSIEKSGSMVGKSGGADAVYVNNMETGLRSTFKFGSDLNGEFYVPSSLEDAQAHYILSSADGKPLIYRINYAKSTFAKDNVSILMDLDLTQMGALNTTYNGSNKVLYGESGIKENFNHTDAEYGDTYDTSTFGNLKKLITSSSRKISLLLKDVLFHEAKGNSTTKETDTAITTTTKGSIDGTLVGYMKADVGHNRVKGNVSYVWGAMQDADGKDVNATDDKVMLTVQFTETTPKMTLINTPPTLELRDKTITAGEELEERDLIAKAEDSDGKDLRNAIQLIDNGDFDNTKAGKYTFTFKVTDKNGTIVTKNAIVTVALKSSPNMPTDPNNPSKPDKPENPGTPVNPDNSRNYSHSHGGEHSSRGSAAASGATIVETVANTPQGPGTSLADSEPVANIEEIPAEKPEVKDTSTATEETKAVTHLNKAVRNVQTGDESRLYLWLTMILASLVAFIADVVYLRKKAESTN